MTNTEPTRCTPESINTGIMPTRRYVIQWNHGASSYGCDSLQEVIEFIKDWVPLLEKDYPNPKPF